LNARQCHETCGLRTKNEPLTTDATPQRTARTTKYEEAMYAYARKTRQRPSARKTTTQASPERKTPLCQHEAET